MKKVAVLCALFSAVLAPHVQAQDECSNGSMRGQYSFVASGTFGGAPFAAAGYGIYDGHGNVQGVIQTSSNGNVNPAAGWTGTYAVKPMTTGGEQTVCVVTKTITIPAYNNLAVSFFVTAADAFKELRFIATTPGATITGTASKE
jgi:hypothetical protein